MKKRPGFFLLLVTLLMICLVAINAFAWPVPDTGQTKCYDNEKEIPCPAAPGEDFYGQDSQYTINPMSYTKLDATGNDLPDDAPSWTMVRDNVTGLIWENKTDDDGTIHYKYNTYTWYDSNPETNGGDPGTPGDGITTFDTEQFINTLNAANYGGYNDWRIPTMKELVSIVDYGIPRDGPAINTTYFSYAFSGMYWSSNTYAPETYGAYVVLFVNGNPACAFYKSSINSIFARAVRGGRSGSLGHLVINGNGTVTDTDTGLMWQRDTPDDGLAWESALSFCETSNLAGYTDWRLPTIKELQTLWDYSRFEPAIDVTYFPDTAFSYWSSTTQAGDTDRMWWVTFSGTHPWEGLFKSDSGYVRPVRGGQAGTLGHSVISAPRQASSWEAGSMIPIRWQTAGLGTTVKISLSRQGGKEGTFETIIASTPNDGQEDWKITGAGAVNCVIKIEQADNPANWATEGLFVIKKRPVNPAMYLLLLE